MLLYASLCIFLTSAFYFVNKAAVPVKQNRWLQAIVRFPLLLPIRKGSAFHTTTKITASDRVLSLYAGGVLPDMGYTVWLPMPQIMSWTCAICQRCSSSSLGSC
jgi:hypothetical protein